MGVDISCGLPVDNQSHYYAGNYPRGHFVHFLLPYRVGGGGENTGGFWWQYYSDEGRLSVKIIDMYVYVNKRSIDFYTK